MKKIAFVIYLLLFVGCSTTQCANKNTESTVPKAEIPTISGVNQMLKVKVFKPDGTLQCNQGQKLGLDAMVKELIGIQIFSSENKHDGLMRIQVCGQPTGTCNVYEILEADLDQAIKFGFKKWNRD